MISKINLKNFRIFKQLELNFNSNLIILKGANASGKTSVLEAINYVSLTKSHRSNKINELIKFNSFFSTIKLYENKDEYHLILSEKGKKVFLNKIEYKKISDYIAHLQVVFFSPSDLELILGSPKCRRDFLDIEATKLSKKYFLYLKKYHDILKQRNQLLKIFKDEYLLLDIITDELVEMAKKVYELRLKIINKLNEILPEISSSLCFKETLKIHYESSITGDFKQAFKKHLERDIKYKTTTIGPHKDDFIFYLNNLDAKKYASQGQIRSIILSIKLALVKLMSMDLKKRPILLLDDVLSELDHNRQNNLLALLTNNVQTFITTTDIDNIDESIIKNSQIIDIETLTKEGR